MFESPYERLEKLFPSPWHQLGSVFERMPRRQWFRTAAIAGGVLLGQSAVTHATPRVVPPPPKPSRELEIVIKLLKEGAAADPQLNDPPDFYAACLLWDATADLTKLPQDCRRFVRVLKGKSVDLDLNYNELWRVWCDLMGILGDAYPAPIMQTYGTEEGYYLWFSRRFTKRERAACADTLASRLTERYVDHRQYLKGLPTPALEM